MAMNLRLRPEVEDALRAEAARSHRSQQDVLRAAVARYLGLDDSLDGACPAQVVDELLVSGRVRAPRSPYRRVVPAADSATDVPSLSLLDRDDRF